MRRLLAVIIGLALTGLALAWVTAGPASAATLPQCLAKQHVCVSADGRALVSAGQQADLERQIGGDSIYLVAATAGSTGYNPAMQQLIASLRDHNRQFVIGFLDSGSKHFGAYNQGILPSGGAASIATTAVSQHNNDVNAALTSFVQDVQQQAGSAADGGSAAPSSSGGVNGGLIALGVIIVAALAGFFLFLRPRRQRRQAEQAEQLAEAKAAAQDDLIALNTAITDHGNDVSIASSPEAVTEQTAALDAYERGTRALDAARSPADMGAVSRSIAEGRYRLACAEAVAHGADKPGRRPMCFFDPRHGMSVADVSWAPPDGGPSRDVAVCLDCERIINRGDQPEMRTVRDRSGGRVEYVNAGFAPAYWGGFGYGGPMLTGFLLGNALATPPVIINDYGYGYGEAGYGGGYGGDNFGGGDFGGGDYGGGDFGGGGDNSGGGDFGGSSF
jgi:type II secretory pathway pseudopilin PulG